ncbi:MAG TPA: ABC transporter ATP-binding protein [Kribbellaceae bacterium]
MIRIENVSCWYGDVVAVNGVTMAIGPGITGLLGPNGAGKSTLISLMAGFMPPSTGAVTLDGDRLWRNAAMYRRIGLVPETESVYDALTGERFVLASAKLHGLDSPGAATAAALATVEMTEVAGRQIATYSKGMKQRIKMAAALVHEPDVLLLDEPFNGMDPRQRLHLMDLLRKMGADGRTVLFSSHILEEVQQLATQIEVLVSGRHAASGDYRAIRAQMTDRPHLYRVRCSDDRRLAAALIGGEGTAGVDLDDGAVQVRVTDFTAFSRALPVLARDLGIRLTEVSPTDESLETVFSYLVGRR